MRRRSTPPAARQRGDVPLPAVGARVRHEQPAGLLEHVPRGERPRADGVARHRQGHVDLEDWEQGRPADRDGANAASNAPRMLTALAEALRRGAQVVHMNPLIEAASRPHDRAARASRDGHLPRHPDRDAERAAAHRRRPGAAARRRQGRPRARRQRSQGHRREFLRRHTAGFEDYRALVAATRWDELVHQSGVDEARIRELAERYLRAERTIVAWCLGITQQEHGVDTVREIVNLLLLRGNIGREGAGPSPVRGHSNVQGNRTCGIDHRPPAELLDRLAEVCGIQPPRERRAGHRRGPSRRCSRRREGLRRHGRQLRARGARHRSDVRRAAQLRAHRAGEHEAQPQPSRSRRAGAHPALPRPQREGRPARAGSRDERRGLDEHGAPLARDEAAGLPAAAVRVRDPRRHGPGDAARLRHAVGGLTSTTTTASATRWRRCSTASRTSTGVCASTARVPHPRSPPASGSSSPRRSAPSSPRAAARRRPARGPPDAGHDALPRPVEHHHLLRQRPLPRGEEPAHARVHERRATCASADSASSTWSTSRASPGRQHALRYGYRAIAYNIPRGSVAGYMPELNVLCALETTASRATSRSRSTSSSRSLRPRRVRQPDQCLPILRRRRRARVRIRRREKSQRRGVVDLCIARDRATGSFLDPLCSVETICRDRPRQLVRPATLPRLLWLRIVL